MKYGEFISKKQHVGADHGFAPAFMPDQAFPFQRELIEWATRKGRAALFADCGMGKTLMQLAWAQNVAQHTGKRVLILTPLSVATQTVLEAHKFGIYAERSQRGDIGKSQIIVTNYERLKLFNPGDFVATVCDESSILKNFDGATKAAVTEFMRLHPYRLLCTATAAPNDFIELGTSSEALGYMGFSDMLGKFFKKSDKTYSRSQEHRHGLYRFRGHSERDFWRWVCSWSRAIRKPSDMGHEDCDFVLPELVTNQHIIEARTRADDWLFDMPAVGLQEERQERRRTINERCEKVAELVNGTGQPAVCWCSLNDEGDILASMIPDAVQVAGKDSDDRKEETFESFARGDIRVLITKPVIAGFGLNWQHCAHQTFFPSHSFEQWYQAIRRSWRFGQKKPVTVDVVTSEGEARVLSNMQRKAEQAEAMFSHLVELMNNELAVQRREAATDKMETPSWL
jgi:hypothetical protein